MSERPKLKVAWVSAGVSSFIAAWLEKETIDRYIYIDIDDQHPDSMRFVKDCEKLLNKPIEILKSPLGSVENAIKQKGGFIKRFNGAGASCTELLKKRVRKEWERQHAEYDLIYLWGLDCGERGRMIGINLANPQAENIYPLIKKNLTKEDAHGLCARLGVKRPVMYDLGYPNNNCIGCVKGGMGYWNKIRKDFPEVFKRMAELERKLQAHFGYDVSLLKENGIPLYLDELDNDRGDMDTEVLEECSLFCEVAQYREEVDNA